MDDKTLLCRISQNDADAFRALVDRYFGALTSFAERILNDRHAAKDVVQEVFATLWVKRRAVNAEPSLRSFLYVSTRNRAFKHIRSIQRQGALSARYMSDYATGLLVIEEEKNRQLMNAIKQLPERTAEVIRYSCDGLSQEQIAGEMGITVSAVKQLKSRGISKLRELLGAAHNWLLYL